LDSPNINILDNERTNLYYLFEKCQFILGLNSTALIESLAFNVKLVVIRFAGWEYFKNLNGDQVEFVSTVDEARNVVLKEAKISKKEVNGFFIPNSKENFSNSIKSILH